MTDHDQKPRTFPINRGFQYKGPAHPLAIPWELAELAYSVYRDRYGSSQSLERLAMRGGFGPCEMDEFVPDWRERCDVIAALRAERDAALARVKEVEGERDALRKSFIYAINHAGGKVSDECSTEFLCMGADQIKLYCDKQRSAYAAVKGEQMELIQTRAGYLAERDEARHERDALKTDNDRLRGLLRIAADKIRACNGWHMTSAEELADRIDQELGQ